MSTKPKAKRGAPSGRKRKAKRDPERVVTFPAREEPMDGPYSSQGNYYTPPAQDSDDQWRD